MQGAAGASALYRSWHVILAAFAGALGSALVQAMLLRPTTWPDFRAAILVWFLLGLPVITVVGLPVARRLARSGRDTVRNGLLYGALGGSITGAVLALLFVFALLGDNLSLDDFWRGGPLAALALLTPAPIGAMFGVVDGAVAGATLAWCGRLGRRNG